MSNNHSSNDLDLQPVRTGLSSKNIVAVAIGVLAVMGAYTLNERNASQRKTEQLQRAADAWADLSRCLVPPGTELGQIARTARRIELGQPSSIARLPPAERRSHWPYRCATFASVMTRALFDSKSDDRRHRILAMVVSQAATDLESGQLHTGRNDRRKYLDELWAAVAQAQLPPGRPTANIAPPPAPAHPVSAPLLDAVLAGTDNAKVLAQDALQLSTLRVLFGLSERRLCTFANDGSAQGLAHFDCRRTRPADFVRAPWLGSADDGQPALFSGRADGNDPHTHGYLEPNIPIGDEIVGGHVSQQNITLLSFDDARSELLVSIRGRTAEGTLDQTRRSQLVSRHTISNRLGGGWVLGNVVIALGQRPAPSGTSSTDGGTAPDAGTTGAANDIASRTDATSHTGPTVGVLYAGALSIDGATERASWSIPFAERATASSAWLREPRVEGCSIANGDIAIVAYTSDGHALVLWKTARGFVAPVVAEARPGSIHCDGDYVRLGWFEPVPVPSAHVSTCGQTGCAHARAPSPDIDTDPVIAPVGNRVLAAYTLRTDNGGNGGLRYRLAPLTELATAPEHVIFDDGEHEGLQVEPALSVFVRGRRAVLFVTSKGVAGETYAFRINEDGSFTPIRRAAGDGHRS
jgi:hypothetical protein